MSDLRGAAALMNWQVRQELEEGDARLATFSSFDPSSLDHGRIDFGPPVVLLEDEALEIGAEDVSMVGGRLGPRAPWEVLP